MKIYLNIPDDLQSEILWEELAAEVFKQTGKEEFTNFEISIRICDEEAIQKLNLEFRGKDSATDVLSFPSGAVQGNFQGLSPEQVKDFSQIESLPLGDIIICLNKAQEQAGKYGHSLHREISFLYVHGLLHLLGYDHQNEKEEKTMFSLQNAILENLKIGR